jgi:hypothetical protein
VEFYPEVSGAKCGAWPDSKYTTLFTADDKEPTESYDEGHPVVLGHRVTSKVAGAITSFRFYKTADEVAASHVGRIYSWPHGTLLGTTGRFSSCKGPAWISVPLNAPVPVKPGVQYVLALEGVEIYAKTADYFTQPKRNGVLTVISSTYNNAATGFPYVDDLEADNYYIDCEYTAL